VASAVWLARDDIYQGKTLMKIRLIVLAALLIIVVILIGYQLGMDLPTGDKTTDLTIALRMDKTNYKPGEPIRALMTLKNAGSKDIVVKQRVAVNLPGMPGEVRDIVFMIKGPLGDVHPSFRVTVRHLLPEDFVVLSPGETIEKSFDIQKIYDLTDIGPYSVSVVYQNAQDPGPFHRRAWKGEITSNVVDFEIVP